MSRSASPVGMPDSLESGPEWQVSGSVCVARLQVRITRTAMATHNVHHLSEGTKRRGFID
eukprot:3726773-Pyramimonas_sp.AAC.1